VFSPSGSSEISTVVDPGVIGLPGWSHPKVNTTRSNGTTSTYSPTAWFFPPTSTRYRPPGRGSMSATVPNHSTCRSGSTRNGQIVCGVASTTISRTSSAITGLLLLGCLGWVDGRGGWLRTVPGLRGLCGVAQALQAGGPEVVQERAQVGHGLGVGAVEAPGAVAPLRDQRGVLEHREVLGDRGAADVGEALGDRRGSQLVG